MNINKNKIIYRILPALTFYILIITPILALLLNSPFFIDLMTNIFYIDEQPDKADAIIVLGGGITGKYGLTSSSWERLMYAIHLYHDKKLAKYLIFTGGRKSSARISEAVKMYEIASGQLGLNKKNIIVESTSKNTYQNIEHLNHIITEKNLNSFIIVTSFPHTLRAYLCFKKIYKNKAAYMLSVPFGLFSFISEKYKCKFFFHEIKGIGYYWIKGYI